MAGVYDLRIKIPGEIDEIKSLEKGLPLGWTVVKSLSTGDLYYLNVITKETTYERPKDRGWFLRCFGCLCYM